MTKEQGRLTGMTNSNPHCPFCASPLQPGAAGGLCPRCLIDSAVREEEDISQKQSHLPEIEGIEIQAEIGEGGFGIVYRAQQVGLVRRKVALKLLKPGVDTRQVLRRFEVERQALAHLEHPGIARFYEAGQTKEGYPYFTMELVEGVPIHEAVGGQTLTGVIRLFLQVCESVAHAHDHGVLHRDLKPGNILVTANGMPKVIDFGLAKALDAQQAPGMTLYTGGESWLGTPGYAAPEQLKASEIEPDERADVYSLGAILYHLLTGMNPEDAREVALPKTDHPRPSEIALQKIEPALDAIVMHALSADREKRYSSVRHLMADLRRYLNGDELSIKTVKPQSRKGPIALGALVLSLAIGGVIYSQRPSDQEAEVPPPAEEKRLENLTFEDLGFLELEEGEAAIPPFLNSRTFCWLRFRKADGGEFILSHDCKHGSSTVTQIFVGGKRPDAPGVRIIPFDTPEDEELSQFILAQIEKTIGTELATKLENTDWDHFPEGKDSRRLRRLKNLLGVIHFFDDHRRAREWIKDEED
ncbi:serine/threonine-protein kinase [Verrucomicrobiaceae bacterium 227]